MNKNLKKKTFPNAFAKLIWWNDLSDVHILTLTNNNKNQINISYVIAFFIYLFNFCRVHNYGFIIIFGHIISKWKIWKGKFLNFFFFFKLHADTFIIFYHNQLLWWLWNDTDFHRNFQTYSLALFAKCNYVQFFYQLVLHSTNYIYCTPENFVNFFFWFSMINNNNKKTISR